ncbi:MAG: hypothetical protein IT289_09775 [Oligoflexia bacterium]|nr:hypothetical protein [Oligoflexia bacterium]
MIRTLVFLLALSIGSIASAGTDLRPFGDNIRYFKLNTYNPYKHKVGQAAGSNCYGYVTGKQGTAFYKVEAKGSECPPRSAKIEGKLQEDQQSFSGGTYVKLGGADKGIEADSVGVRLLDNGKLEFVQFDNGSTGGVTQERELNGEEVHLKDVHSVEKLRKEVKTLEAKREEAHARRKPFKDENKYQELKDKLQAFDLCDNVPSTGGCVTGAVAVSTAPTPAPEVSVCDAAGSSKFKSGALDVYCVDSASCTVEKCREQYGRISNPDWKDENTKQKLPAALKAAAQALKKAQEEFNKQVAIFVEGQQAAKDNPVDCVRLHKSTKKGPFQYHHGVELVRELDSIEADCKGGAVQEPPSGGATSTR